MDFTDLSQEMKLYSTSTYNYIDFKESKEGR